MGEHGGHCWLCQCVALMLVLLDAQLLVQAQASDISGPKGAERHDFRGTGQGAFTVSAWLYVEDADTDHQALFSVHSSRDDRWGWCVAVKRRLQPALLEVTMNTNTSESAQTGFSLQGSTWNHITVVYDGLSMMLVVNGNVSQSIECGQLQDPTLSKLHVDGHQSVSNQHQTLNQNICGGPLDLAWIAEVAVWNASLSLQQITSMVQSCPGAAPLVNMVPEHLTELRRFPSAASAQQPHNVAAAADAKVIVAPGGAIAGGHRLLDCQAASHTMQQQGGTGSQHAADGSSRRRLNQSPADAPTPASNSSCQHSAEVIGLAVATNVAVIIAIAELFYIWNLRQQVKRLSDTLQAVLGDGFKSMNVCPSEKSRGGSLTSLQLASLAHSRMLIHNTSANASEHMRSSNSQNGILGHTMPHLEAKLVRPNSEAAIKSREIHSAYQASSMLLPSYAFATADSADIHAADSGKQRSSLSTGSHIHTPSRHASSQSAAQAVQLQLLQVPAQRGSLRPSHNRGDQYMGAGMDDGSVQALDGGHNAGSIQNWGPLSSDRAAAHSQAPNDGNSSLFGSLISNLISVVGHTTPQLPFPGLKETPSRHSSLTNAKRTVSVSSAAAAGSSCHNPLFMAQPYGRSFSSNLPSTSTNLTSPHSQHLSNSAAFASSSSRTISGGTTSLDTSTTSPVKAGWDIATTSTPFGLPIALSTIAEGSDQPYRSFATTGSSNAAEDLHNPSSRNLQPITDDEGISPTPSNQGNGHLRLSMHNPNDQAAGNELAAQHAAAEGQVLGRAYLSHGGGESMSAAACENVAGANQTASSGPGAPTHTCEAPADAPAVTSMNGAGSPSASSQASRRNSLSRALKSLSSFLGGGGASNADGSGNARSRGVSSSGPDMAAESSGKIHASNGSSNAEKRPPAAGTVPAGARSASATGMVPNGNDVGPAGNPFEGGASAFSAVQLSVDSRTSVDSGHEASWPSNSMHREHPPNRLVTRLSTPSLSTSSDGLAAISRLGNSVTRYTSSGVSYLSRHASSGAQPSPAGVRASSSSAVGIMPPNSHHPQAAAPAVIPMGPSQRALSHEFQAGAGPQVMKHPAPRLHSFSGQSARGRAMYERQPSSLGPGSHHVSDTHAYYAPDGRLRAPAPAAQAAPVVPQYHRAMSHTWHVKPGTGHAYEDMIDPGMDYEPTVPYQRRFTYNGVGPVPQPAAPMHAPYHEPGLNASDPSNIVYQMYPREVWETEYEPADLSPAPIARIRTPPTMRQAPDRTQSTFFEFQGSPRGSPIMAHSPSQQFVAGPMLLSSLVSGSTPHSAASSPSRFRDLAMRSPANRASAEWQHAQGPWQAQQEPSGPAGSGSFGSFKQRPPSPATTYESPSAESSIVVVTDHDPVLPDVSFEMQLNMDVTLDSDEALGSGTYGSVYRGQYRGHAVAVKFALKSVVDGLMQKGALETLQQEARILSRVRHPNIVRFYGGSLQPPNVFIVEELMQQDLSVLVHGQDALLPLDDVLRIGKDIAMGLFHLHPTVVHRDLKPANVLIDSFNNAKISDFGMARFKLSNYLSTRTPDAGTVAYMAPECFQDNAVTPKADVYSWAMIMCEMLTAQLPWYGCNSMGIIYNVVFKGVRPDLPENPLRCPPDLANLIRDCWHPEAKSRPSTGEIVKILTLIMKMRERQHQQEAQEMSQQ